MAAARRQERQPRARGLCRHFVGNLAKHARAGDGAILADHRHMIVGEVACTIDLDRSLKKQVPDDDRWDYVVVARKGGMPAMGMEVHHAAATEVQKMIKKKTWAQALLKRECKALTMHSWHWIIPSSGVLLFTPNDSRARMLAIAGITFPRKQLVLP